MRWSIRCQQGNILRIFSKFVLVLPPLSDISHLSVSLAAMFVGFSFLET